MELVILMGLQATGKSTSCRERFYCTHLRINLDLLKTRPRERALFPLKAQARHGRTDLWIGFLAGRCPGISADP